MVARSRQIKMFSKNNSCMTDYAIQNLNIFISKISHYLINHYCYENVIIFYLNVNLRRKYHKILYNYIKIAGNQIKQSLIF